SPPSMCRRHTSLPKATSLAKRHHLPVRASIIPDRVRAKPAVNVPKAHIIAEGNIISEAASFARQGKHHSRKGAGEARP
ncbi:MAG: hypothetical protein IIZ66_05075, partial [Clostridia bacterium]|nr:hypothetical protein [Clostridia bacterium]